MSEAEQAQRDREERERKERERREQAQAKARQSHPAADSGSSVWAAPREPFEASAQENPEADAPEKGNWLYSGPAVVPPDPRLKVWRQNRATGACEEAVLAEGQKDDRTGYFHAARKTLAGGGERLQSKDFPHAPTAEQEAPYDDPDARSPQAKPPEKTEEARARQAEHQPA